SMRVTLLNSAYITNTYDKVARLLTTKLLNSSGTTTFDSYAYVYDPANERTNLTRLDNSTVAYTYDNIGQLKVAGSTTNREDRRYLYDAARTLNRRTNNGVTTQFTVDSKNQLSAVGGQPYAYDGNGNLTGVGTNTNYSYVYDDENRLI